MIRDGHLPKYKEILTAAGFIAKPTLFTVSGYCKGKYTVCLSGDGWELTESQWQRASGSHYESLPSALKELK
jgi:hypothetical protein